MATAPFSLFQEVYLPVNSINPFRRFRSLSPTTTGPQPHNPKQNNDSSKKQRASYCDISRRTHSLPLIAKAARRDGAKRKKQDETIQKRQSSSAATAKEETNAPSSNAAYKLREFKRPKKLKFEAYKTNQLMLKLQPQKLTPFCDQGIVAAVTDITEDQFTPQIRKMSSAQIINALARSKYAKAIKKLNKIAEKSHQQFQLESSKPRPPRGIYKTYDVFSLYKKKKVVMQEDLQPKNIQPYGKLAHVSKPSDNNRRLETVTNYSDVNNPTVVDLPKTNDESDVYYSTQATSSSTGSQNIRFSRDFSTKSEEKTNKNKVRSRKQDDFLKNCDYLIEQYRNLNPNYVRKPVSYLKSGSVEERDAINSALKFVNNYKNKLFFQTNQIPMNIKATLSSSTAAAPVESKPSPAEESVQSESAENSEKQEEPKNATVERKKYEFDTQPQLKLPEIKRTPIVLKTGPKANLLQTTAFPGTPELSDPIVLGKNERLVVPWPSYSERFKEKEVVKTKEVGAATSSFSGATKEPDLTNGGTSKSVTSKRSYSTRNLSLFRKTKSKLPDHGEDSPSKSGTIKSGRGKRLVHPTGSLRRRFGADKRFYHVPVVERKCEKFAGGLKRPKRRYDPEDPVKVTPKVEETAVIRADDGVVFKPKALPTIAPSYLPTFEGTKGPSEKVTNTIRFFISRLGFEHESRQQNQQLLSYKNLVGPCYNTKVHSRVFASQLKNYSATPFTFPSRCKSGNKISSGAYVTTRRAFCARPLWHKRRKPNMYVQDCPCLPHDMPEKSPRLRRLPKINVKEPPKICLEIIKCDVGRADDGMVLKPRSLPCLKPKYCPCVKEPEMQDVKLCRLPKVDLPDPPRVCLEEKECVVPRADEGLKVEQKNLPCLKAGDCPCVEQDLVDAPPLVRLKPKPILQPPRICPPKEQCPERADKNLVVRKKKLPVLESKHCPCLPEPELQDVKLPRLPKVNIPEPPRVCLEEKTCVVPRADEGLKIIKKTLPCLPASPCPCINVDEPEKAPQLKRLPKVKIPEPPKVCAEIVRCDIPRADEGLVIKPKELPCLKPKFCPCVQEPQLEDVKLTRLPKIDLPDPPRVCLEEKVCTIPRADEGLEIRPKTLPCLKAGDCPCVETDLADAPPLVRLKPKPVRPPPRICVKISDQCPERADKNLTVKRKKLPLLEAKSCPCVPEPELTDVKLVRLPKINLADPPRVCVEEKVCTVPRADEGMKIKKKELPCLAPSPCPCIDTNVPEKAPLLKRLPKVKIPEPPKICVTVLDCTIPRADDGMVLKPKSLPCFRPKHCPCVEEPALQDVKLQRLPKVDLPDPPRICVSEKECTVPRADEGLTVKPKMLPCIKAGQCPCQEVEMTDAPPLVRLKPKPVAVPPRICPGVEKCPERADKDLIIKKKQLPRLRAKSCPCVSEPELKDVKLPRLGKVDIPDPPRICINEEECILPRADDLLKYKPKRKKLLTMILCERNNEVSTREYAQAKKYSESKKRHFGTWTDPLLCSRLSPGHVGQVKKFSTVSSDPEKCKKLKKKDKKECPKIALPNCTPGKRRNCKDQVKSKDCVKQQTPYKSFSECKDPDPEMLPTECLDEMRHLQPKFPILGVIEVQKPPPPHQDFIDPRKEEDCIYEKLGIEREPGTKTCDDFHLKKKSRARELLAEYQAELEAKAKAQGTSLKKLEDAALCEAKHLDKSLPGEKEVNCPLVDHTVYDKDPFEKLKEDCEGAEKPAEKDDCKRPAKKKCQDGKQYVKERKEKKSLQCSAPPCPCPVNPPKSLWQRILDFFRPREDCPPPDEWKKKLLRDRAEKAAAAAGLNVCDDREKAKKSRECLPERKEKQDDCGDRKKTPPSWQDKECAKVKKDKDPCSAGKKASGDGEKGSKSKQDACKNTKKGEKSSKFESAGKKSASSMSSSSKKSNEIDKSKSKNCEAKEKEGGEECEGNEEVKYWCGLVPQKYKKPETVSSGSSCDESSNVSFSCVPEDAKATGVVPKREPLCEILRREYEAKAKSEGKAGKKACEPAANKPAKKKAKGKCKGDRQKPKDPCKKKNQSKQKGCGKSKPKSGRRCSSTMCHQEACNSAVLYNKRKYSGYSWEKNVNFGNFIRSNENKRAAEDGKLVTPYPSFSERLAVFDKTTRSKVRVTREESYGEDEVSPILKAFNEVVKNDSERETRPPDPERNVHVKNARAVRNRQTARSEEVEEKRPSKEVNVEGFDKRQPPYPSFSECVGNENMLHLSEYYKSFNLTDLKRYSTYSVLLCDLRRLPRGGVRNVSALRDGRLKEIGENERPEGEEERDAEKIFDALPTKVCDSESTPGSVKSCTLKMSNCLQMGGSFLRVENPKSGTRHVDKRNFSTEGKQPKAAKPRSERGKKKKIKKRNRSLGAPPAIECKIGKGGEIVCSPVDFTEGAKRRAEEKFSGESHDGKVFVDGSDTKMFIGFAEKKKGKPYGGSSKVKGEEKRPRERITGEGSKREADSKSCGNFYNLTSQRSGSDPCEDKITETSSSCLKETKLNTSLLELCKCFCNPNDSRVGSRWNTFETVDNDLQSNILSNYEEVVSRDDDDDFSNESAKITKDKRKTDEKVEHDGNVQKVLSNIFALITERLKRYEDRNFHVYEEFCWNPDERINFRRPSKDALYNNTTGYYIKRTSPPRFNLVADADRMIAENEGFRPDSDYNNILKYEEAGTYPFFKITHL